MFSTKTTMCKQDKYIQQLEQNISEYALAIDGVPKNASEALQKRGWLLPYLFSYDDLLWGRWEYWHRIMIKKTIEGSGPIPQIKWVDLFKQQKEVKKNQDMLRRCINDRHREANIHSFAEWLLWGLAVGKEQPNISERVNEKYYKTFDIFHLLKYPTDYMSTLLMEQSGKGYKEALGYYPTPMQVVIAMNDMVISNEDPEVLKHKKIYDPAVGCGACLLPASNHMLRGYGNDVSHIAVKLCKIQCYFYAPWYAIHPKDIRGYKEH